MTNPSGRFGIHGGQYIPETLMNAVIELEEAYNRYKDDEDFNRELAALLNDRAVLDNLRDGIPFPYTVRDAVLIIMPWRPVMRQRYVPFVMRSPTKTCIVIWNWHSILIIIRLWRSIPRPARKRVR